jgi:hypothetical protein
LKQPHAAPPGCPARSSGARRDSAGNERAVINF